MNNSAFLDILKKSFLKYLETNARSNEKLKILHKAIAEDIISRLREQKSGEDFAVSSLGVGAGREEKVDGRYVKKAVDITISKNGKPIAGIAVKYIMSNYKQNTNNYFENMLGETANIRCADVRYFQIFVIPDKIPYFDNDGKITKWEFIDENNIQKYIILSHDNIDRYMHTPDKTLVFVVNMPSDEKASYSDKSGYVDYYTKTPFQFNLSPKTFEFGQTVVYNDYEKFAEKITHAILSI